MTLPLPFQVSHNETQNNFDEIAQKFPLTPNNILGNIPTTTATLPTGTYSGQDFYYSLGSGVWHFKYNTSTAKWDFAGGPALAAAINTSQSTASLTYTALGTVGPSVTVPFTGDYLVTVAATVGVNNATLTRGWMSFDIGGTNAVDADAVEGGTFQFSSVSRTLVKTGLTATTALVARYRSDDGATTATFKNRWIAITPVRLG